MKWWITSTAIYKYAPHNAPHEAAAITQIRSNHPDNDCPDY
jgi:hypothetical protein